MSNLYAHALYDRLPDELFDVKWDWDPTLIFFLVLLVLYIRGLRSFKRKVVKPWQRNLFFLGIALLVLALLPPIDPLSDQLFFMHMIQHMMISHLGVPLMMFGIPFFIVIRGMPLWFRRWIYFPFLRSGIPDVLSKTIARPVPALMLFEFNYWFWHVPRFYNMALLNDIIHLVEHACFAITSILIWRVIIDPKPMRSPLPLPGRILALGLMMALNIILSAILTFSDKLLYAYEGIPMPSWFAHWGHFEDQRLGGLIMWVPGGLIMLIAMTIVFFVWARREGAVDLQSPQQLARSAN